MKKIFCLVGLIVGVTVSGWGQLIQGNDGKLYVETSTIAVQCCICDEFIVVALYPSLSLLDTFDRAGLMYMQVGQVKYYMHKSCMNALVQSVLEEHKVKIKKTIAVQKKKGSKK